MSKLGNGVTPAWTCVDVPAQNIEKILVYPLGSHVPQQLIPFIGIIGVFRDECRILLDFRRAEKAPELLKSHRRYSTLSAEREVAVLFRYCVIVLGEGSEIPFMQGHFYKRADLR